MPHTSIAAYITAVRQALEDDEIAVLDHHVDHGDTPHARIELDVEQDDLAFDDLQTLSLQWDSDRGWWITLVYQPGVGLAPPPIYRGISLVPIPEVVTAWAATVLTHPEIIASRDEPIRIPGDAAEIESTLASYEPASR